MKCKIKGKEYECVAYTSFNYLKGTKRECQEIHFNKALGEVLEMGFGDNVPFSIIDDSNEQPGIQGEVDKSDFSIYGGMDLRDHITVYMCKPTEVEDLQAVIEALTSNIN